MKILISNDDGVHAPGIAALAGSMKAWGKTTVVAPEKEKSTTGHSLTLHKPLRIHRLSNGFYRCSGGPADCVYLGANEVMKSKPDLVVSGINHGANLGQDVFLSGTVSAAREASNMRIPAMSVSLCLDFNKIKQPMHYETAARASSEALRRVLAAFGKSPKAALKAWPQGLLINVNVPNVPYSKLKGYRIATQGHRYYSGKILQRTDARGRKYYWIGGTYEGFEPLPKSDCEYVDQGYVSITPLELDTTMKDVFHYLEPLIDGKRA
jgi:5'-nucleotidase